MSSIVDSLRAVPSRSAKDHVQPQTSLWFDGIMIVLSIWFLTGLVLDGNAHNQGLVDSFFTPWHLVLYSGFAASGGWVFLSWARNIRNGLPWQIAIPVGYELSVVGAAIFAVGGVLDLLWHTIFGIEVSFEALVSPSHLILALGIFLIMSGPFRAAWRRADPERSTLLSYLPMLLSLTFTLSILTFFTFPLHPFANVYAGMNRLGGSGSRDQSVMVGFSNILLQSAILMGCLLLALRRWRLPLGSITFVILLNTLTIAAVTNQYEPLLIALVPGVVGDGLNWWLKPSPQNPRALRLFAFVVPTVLYLAYFAYLAATQGVWWTMPTWSGAACLAGVVGLLMSYVMLPTPGQISEQN